MRSIEVKGKNVKVACQKGLEQLALREEQVDIEILDEGDEGGFLGIGRRPALVRLTEKDLSDSVENVDYSLSEHAEAFDYVPNSEDESLQEEKEEEQSTVPESLNNQEHAESHVKSAVGDSSISDVDYAAMEFVKEYLQTLLSHLKSEAEIEARLEGNYIKVSIDGDDCGILIGRRGETLQAMQYLTSLAMIKKFDCKKRLQLDIGGYYRKRRGSLVALARKTADRALKTGSAYELSPMKSSERRIVHEALQNYKGIVTYSEGEEPKRYVVIDLTEDYFKR